MFRFMLFRRHIDPALLTVAMACMVIKLGPEVFIFGFFAAIGTYLLFGWHQTRHYVDSAYAVPAILYAAGAVLLGLTHGPLSQEMRWMAYPLFLILGVFLFPGVVLIKDPLRQVILGARIGIAVGIALGSLEMVSGLMRIGFGGNAANTAFVIAVCGVLARIPARNPWRYLPNSRLWFYLAMLLLLMTGTRSLFPLVFLALAIDAWAWRKAFSDDGPPQMKGRRLATLLLAVTLTTGALAYQLADPIAARFQYTAGDIEAALDEDGGDLTSLTIRFALWKHAVDFILEHPLVGGGGIESMAAIKSDIPDEQRPVFRHFNHVHNFVLDELRLRGGIGLILMLAFFVATMTRLFARGTNSLREAGVLLVASMVLYGLLHGLLLADRNMALIAIALSMMLLTIKKRAFWLRVGTDRVSAP